MAHVSDTEPGDALVIFGITGDLARKMTFRSLYRLERRGLLDCPIIGVAVDDWSEDQLRAAAREAIVKAGEELDEQAFDRLAARLSYVSGDFSSAAVFERVKAALGGARVPVHYLEIPPSLFATVVAGLAAAGALPPSSRVIVEKPFGHDLPSARALAHSLHEHLEEHQLFRIDHFLGKMGLDEFLYLRFANTLLEPIWNRHHIASVQITMAEQFGVEDRGRFYDAVGALRDVVVNHLLAVLAAAAMEAPAGNDPTTLADAKFAVLRAMPDADPRAYVRGRYDGYLEIDGVAAGSETETFAALRLEIDNWRWAGVPWLIRTGKRLPLTQTEVRLIFRHPPRLGFLRGGDRRPEPSQIVVRIDPDTGIEIVLDALRADRPGPAPVELTMRLATAGGEPPTPYEVLLHAALVGDSSRFARQDSVEESWRVLTPLLEAPPPLEPYAPGSWGPRSAARLTRGYAPWHAPWLP